MAKRENYVSRDQMIPIWCAFAWRYGLGFVIQFLIAESDSLLLYIIGLLLDCWIWQWAVRESLRDRYEGFTLKAENKKSGLSIYDARGRVSIWVALRVWWALTWRLSLISIAICVGFVFTALVTNKSVVDAVAAQFTTQTEYFTDAMMFLFSPWALHESLADRYWGFRFAAQPKPLASTGGGDAL